MSSSSKDDPKGQPTHTHQLDAELEAILDRYEEAVARGEQPDVDELCRELPGREQELRSVIAAINVAAKHLESRPSTPSGAAGAETEPLLGSSLTAASRLKQLRFHARGGLGCVFKAHDEDIGRDVAVKAISQQKQHDKESQERFLREAEVTGRLRHPGIIPVYSRGETMDGRPFFVMPFLEEGTLEEAINAFHDQNHQYRSNDRQFRDLLSRYIAACQTVAYAHSRGVVHRDLKPHNIMLGRYGETLVIDWGLAEKSRRDIHHRLTGEQSIEVRGSSSASSSSGGFTPQYASPEQMDGTLAVGPASDVYSLGAILYKLVSGTTPLRGTTLGEIRKACLNGEFPSPRERNRSVPAPLNAICLRAMQTNPDARYSSPEDLAADVEAYLADSPVAAAPDTAIGKAARMVRREWPAVMTTMAGLLVLVVLALLTAVKQGSLKADARASSLDRLELAATLAAQAGGEEVNRRWRLLELEETSPLLRQSVESLNEAWENLEARDALQAHMTERFVHAREIDELKLASFLVQGVDGRIFSRVPRVDTSIGNFYAYRDYFHGEGEDLSEHSNPPPATGVVRSTVFVSTVTGKPHVALSVPIHRPAVGEQTDEVIGRLTMTMLVGDLGMFDYLGADEVPMLVETRKYDWGERSSFGVVVHHPDAKSGVAPVTEGADTSLPVVEESHLNDLLSRWERTRRSDEVVSALSVADFIDPINGNTTEAAFAPVTVKGRPVNERDTGWFVILHPRRDKDRSAP
ncbi:MAG: serine/threonine protein kinase [Planctomycetaceae bacterium]|nr:serine/threonine protein kinase [Planctomycetaceae bacterium]